MWSSDDMLSASVNCIKLNICQLWYCENNVSSAGCFVNNLARLILFSQIYFGPNQLTISQTNRNKPGFFGKLVLWNSPQLWKIKCKKNTGPQNMLNLCKHKAGLYGTCFCKCAWEWWLRLIACSVQVLKTCLKALHSFPFCSTVLCERQSCFSI